MQFPNSAVTVQKWLWTDSRSMKGHSCVPIKLYFQEQVERCSGHDHCDSTDWLVLCQLDTGQSHLGKKSTNWENVRTRLACGQTCASFSWVAIDVLGPAHCGWCQHWARGPWRCEKSGWSQEERDNKQCFSSHLLLPPGSSLTWVPALTSLDDGL